MNELYRNKSGYWDPTAGKAISRIEREERKKAKQKEEIKNPKVEMEKEEKAV